MGTFTVMEFPVKCNSKQLFFSSNEEVSFDIAHITVFFFFAAHAHDYRPRVLSKSFHYQLRQSEKQTLIGQCLFQLF